jgi:C1A family cysteine protease
LVSNENGNLTFINSWGQKWGDDGYFTIENENVLDHLQFFDVYWLPSDMTAKEKRA